MKIYYDKWNEELVTESEARKTALEEVVRDETYLEALREMSYETIWDMLSEEQQDEILDEEVEKYLEDEDNFISRNF